jgi:hypothetical protein
MSVCGLTRLSSSTPSASCATLARGTSMCHYMIQPLVELYGGCMVVLKVP